MRKQQYNIEYHIERIGLKTLKDYQDWCVKNGFSTALNKNPVQLNKEHKYYIAQKAISVLKKRQKKTFKQIIAEIKNGEEFFFEEIYSSIAKIYKNIKTEYYQEYADLFLDILLFLNSNSKMIQITYLPALEQIVLSKDYWIRPFDTWVSKSHNVHKQFSSFIRHLIAKYDVPLFMDTAWTSVNISISRSHAKSTFQHPDNKYQDWFIHIASGKNIRTAKNLPFPLTKKEAHYFLQAPDDCSINEAFSYGRLLAMGGNDRLFKAFRPTFIVTRITNEKFPQSVMKFFIDNPMLDLAHVGSICDYIHNQKYIEQRVFTGEGQVEMARAPQPNFSMTGRTPEALLNQVERWHRQLGKETKGRDLKWPHCNISDFELQYGSNEKHNTRFWKIKEVLNSKELIVLGRALRNCVASYSHSCQRGVCSIWAMSYEAYEKNEFVLAIEVIRTKQITQIRGKNNRFATPQEMSIINEWAIKEGLSVASYVGR